MAVKQRVMFEVDVIGSPLMVDQKNVIRIVKEALEKNYCGCEITIKPLINEMSDIVKHKDKDDVPY